MIKPTRLLYDDYKYKLQVRKKAFRLFNYWSTLMTFDSYLEAYDFIHDMKNLL